MSGSSIRFEIRNGHVMACWDDDREDVDLGSLPFVAKAMSNMLDRPLDSATLPSQASAPAPAMEVELPSKPPVHLKPTTDPKPDQESMGDEDWGTTPEPLAEPRIQSGPEAPVGSAGADPMQSRQIERRRARHELTISGRIVTRLGARNIVVLDLSETGCRFEDRLRGLEAGEEISIKIGPVGPMRAEAKWSRGGYVGVAFATPLYPSVLDHIRNHFDMRR